MNSVQKPCWLMIIDRSPALTEGFGHRRGLTKGELKNYKWDLTAKRQPLNEGYFMIFSNHRKKRRAWTSGSHEKKNKISTSPKTVRSYQFWQPARDLWQSLVTLVNRLFPPEKPMDYSHDFQPILDAHLGMVQHPLLRLGHSRLESWQVTNLTSTSSTWFGMVSNIKQQFILVVCYFRG